MEFLGACGVYLNWVSVILWLGFACSVLAIVKQYGVGLKDALLAFFGRRRYQRTPLVNGLFIGTMVLSTGLLVWVFGFCSRAVDVAQLAVPPAS